MCEQGFDHTLEWRANRGAASAVALVIHGLNVKPQCMGFLGHELNKLGIATLYCALSGHGDNYQLSGDLTEDEARLAALGRVTYVLWRDEAAAAYRVAAQQADHWGVPIVLVAFSLGALIGCTSALQCADIQFAKLVLFAPALCIHRSSYVLKLLARWPQLVVPSLTPAMYRTNPGTAIAAYNALYAAQHDFEQAIGRRLNVPALVFVDPYDEMVSSRGLQQLILRHKLSQWQVQLVHKTAGANTRYHHLLIDRGSVGTATWRQMMEHMRAHLVGVNS
jgi:alpha-beta hydrolase superfamily lysophospholipase